MDDLHNPKKQANLQWLHKSVNVHFIKLVGWKNYMWLHGEKLKITVLTAV